MSSERVRLQKFMADEGVASRRQSEVMIEEGQVEVDGKIAELGTKVDPAKNVVTVNGKRIGGRGHKATLVLAVHKPRGYLCSNRDPHHERTVFTLLPPSLAKERLFCAGRLDKESEGLVILTNDGALSQRLTHPSNQIVKRYRVLLDRPFDLKHTRNLLQGITWEGERLKVEKVIPEKVTTEIRRLELHLGHGKKREIRRLLIALGYGVKRLQRFQIGGLKLRGIASGRAKVLQEDEIEQLFR